VGDGELVGRIVEVLRGRVGAEQAITAEGIAAAVGLGTGSAGVSPARMDGASGRDARAPAGNNSGAVRQVRLALALHLDELPWPVVADTNGYYRAGTAGEVSHYLAALLSRATECVRRAAAVRRQADADGLGAGAEQVALARLLAHLEGVAR